MFQQLTSATHGSDQSHSKTSGSGLDWDLRSFACVDDFAGYRNLSIGVDRFTDRVASVFEFISWTLMFLATPFALLDCLAAAARI
jgi:hypothetical protein